MSRSDSHSDFPVPRIQLTIFSIHLVLPPPPPSSPSHKPTPMLFHPRGRACTPPRPFDYDEKRPRWPTSIKRGNFLIHPPPLFFVSAAFHFCSRRLRSDVGEVIASRYLRAPTCAPRCEASRMTCSSPRWRKRRRRRPELQGERCVFAFLMFDHLVSLFTLYCVCIHECAECVCECLACAQSVKFRYRCALAFPVLAFFYIRVYLNNVMPTSVFVNLFVCCVFRVLYLLPRYISHACFEKGTCVRTMMIDLIVHVAMYVHLPVVA